MRKSILTSLLLLAAPFVSAEVLGDIFPYENRTSSFTVEVDASQLERFSVQVVYSTPTVADSRFTQDAVNLVDDTIRVPSHEFATAMAVHLASAPLTAPNPLVAGTTYYAIKVSDDLIQLATTYAQAVSGDKINILTAPALALTLRPLPLSVGSAGYLWYGSNDGANWTAVNSVGLTVAESTQTLTVMGAFGGSRLHNWGEFAYRFLRFDFRGPVHGVIKLRAFINGKRSE